MKGNYHFSILRYTYDPLTQEFVNVGVVVYAPQHGFLRAQCTSHYSRISKMFRRIDGTTFRGLTRYIQHQMARAQESMEKGSLFGEESLERILRRILPEDDSAIRFAGGGVGLTDDPAQTLAALYERYVSRYEVPADAVRRDDEDVWKVFREPMEQKKVLSHLTAKKITAPNYEYEFQRSWKNGIWRVYEPMSFDLLDANSLLEKANRWLGRATSLADSSEPFKLFVLLGEPNDPDLAEAFGKAQKILAKMPGQSELVRERDAAEFAEELEAEMEQSGVVEG